MYITLREEIKRIAGHEDVLIEILEHALEYMQKGYFVTPDEKHRILRVIPYLMLLIDGTSGDARSINIFRTKVIDRVS